MGSKITLKSAGPFLLLTFIYFIVGFLTTVNGQCQGPLKIAFLSEVTDTKNSLATLISFAFFLGYLLNSSRTGKMLNRIGYKSTLVRSMIVMVAGLGFYLASALCAEYWGGAGMHLGHDFVPFGYFVFLFGSYLMGTSAAMLQVVINPYIAAYPLPGTQPVQRMNFTCAINSIGTTVAPRPMLITITIAAIALMTVSMFTENLWLMAAVGLFHSVMWSCIFTLSVDGLKEYTSKASGIFMMGVFGGAVFPVIQGLLADYVGSWQYTWLVPLLCEFVILWYGLIGYRKQEKM